MAMEVLRIVFRYGVRVHPPYPLRLPRSAMRISSRKSGKEQSFVSFIITRDAGVNQALTFNQHFVQAGFQALMVGRPGTVSAVVAPPSEITWATSNGLSASRQISIMAVSVNCTGCQAACSTLRMCWRAVGDAA